MNTRKNGSYFEDKACEYLKIKGCTILERNFRCRYGEIDMIVRDGSHIVFVEVKHRQAGTAGSPLEAVTREKMKRISNTARYYLMKNGISEYTPMRFDVVGYLGDEVTWVRDAFDYIGM